MIITERVNGCVIKAFAETSESEAVILAYREYGEEWITAVVGTVGVPTEWVWGHYFGADRDSAFTDFFKRVNERLPLTQHA